MIDYTNLAAKGHIELNSTAQWKCLFELCPQPIAFVGLDGKFLKVNQALAKFLEYTDIELEDKTFTEITHPEDIGIDWANLKQVERREKDTYTMKKRYITKTGKIVDIMLTVFAVVDDNNSVIHYVAHIVPIDEDIMYQLKKAEEDSRLSKSTKEYIFDFVVEYWKPVLLGLAAIYGGWIYVAELKSDIQHNSEINKELIEAIKDLKKNKSINNNPNNHP